MVDSIFYNGKFYTMVNENETVEAVAVNGGKIVGIGTNMDLVQMETRERIDMAGHVVLPGFEVSHVHFLEDSLYKRYEHLSDAGSFDEITARMRIRLQDLPDGEWLYGYHLHKNRLKEDAFPTRDVLDKVTKDVPFVIGSFCGHTSIFNSKALELCGINEHYIPDNLSHVEFGQDGKPTGIIREEQYWSNVYPRIVNNRSYAECIAALKKNLKEYVSNGITTIHTMDTDNTERFDLYQDIRDEGALICRVIINTYAPVPNNLRVRSGFGDNMIKLGAKKLFTDGSVASASAALSVHYPGQANNYGILIYTQDELDAEVANSYQNGMELSVHAIGDQAIKMALDAFAKTYDPTKGWSQRLRIEHATILGNTQHEEILRMMRELPVIVSTNPEFINNYTGMIQSVLGSELTDTVMPIRTYMDNGILVTAGPDAPVHQARPMNGIHNAVNRQDIYDDSDETIAPKEAISVYEAVCLYTKNAAFCMKEESLKGTIEVGKLADFAVLDADIFTLADTTRLCKTEVLQTILGGETVYLAD